ncbi:MAG: succinate dehydrogenase, cytochrome b556 subunit [Chloroflexi bacterium]|nr:succinate dehydrogenase, cytochrome b556 subunit [Chloroflexota bacterium]
MYRGREGMWAWILHRVSGVAVLLFLVVHVLDTALVGFGPKVYDDVMRIYKLPLFRVGEVALAGAVIYHALNGVRVMLVDFWPAGALYHRQMFYAVVVASAVIFLPAAFLMLQPLFTPTAVAAP